MSRYDLAKIRRKLEEWEIRMCHRQELVRLQLPDPLDAEIISYRLCLRLIESRPRGDGYEVTYGNTKTLRSWMHECTSWELLVLGDDDGDWRAHTCECDSIRIKEAYVQIKVSGRRAIFILCDGDGVKLCKELPMDDYQYYEQERNMGDLGVLRSYPYEYDKLFQRLEKILRRLGWPVSLD